MITFNGINHLAMATGDMIEPGEGTRFGLTYRSEVDLDFKDSASLRAIST